MKNILTKISVFSIFALFLTASVSAQITLRKALDFDGDSKADFTIFRPSSNAWYTLKSSGGYSVQQFGSSNTDYMTPGDYDGDNKADIAVWRETDGVWYRLNSSNSTFYAAQFGALGDEPIARDYDGDGKTDFAVVRRTSSAMIWYVLRSSNGSFFAVQFGLPTDFTAPGDYDGDGKFDFAVQRAGSTATSAATFYIQRSSNSSIVDIIQWGFGTDLIVPGDYDGDGKTDIAVLREGALPTDGLSWYIRRSSDGGFTARSFGVTGSDLTVQNDYDGDGKTDLAIWRDSNASFYILNSSTNVITGAQWGLASDFPVGSYDSH